jgi:peptidyl-prolyl cis-trans isomerase C
MITLSGLLLIVSCLIIGCGGENKSIVARVGGDKILTQDLNDIFERDRQQFASFDEEFRTRRDIVDSLVIQQLLIQEAYRRNVDEVEEVNRIVLANSDNFLLDVLFDEKITSKISVTEDDIKDFYNMLEFKVHAFHIVVPDEDTALMIADSLKKGGNFENLAVNYSMERQAATTRGDLGYFVWGQLDPEFQEQAFKLEPGQISEPFKTRFGWHIVKMVDKAPNELRDTFAKMRPQIVGALETIQRNELLMAYRDEMIEKYTINIDTITCQYLANKRASLYPPSMLKTMPKSDFDITKLDRHEKDLILAGWDGGQMTLGQYLGKIQRVDINLRPNLDDYDSMAKFIFQLEFENLLKVEARRIGLENDERYRGKIKKFKELTMADIMENDSIPKSGQPDEGEIRQYYEENSGEFLIPPQAHIYEILLDNYTRAEDYSKKIPTFDRFKTLAKQLTVRSGKRNVSGDLGWIDGRSYPKYYEAALNSDIGKVVGPITVGKKHAIIYIKDKKEEQLRDFLSVKQQIRDKLVNLKRRNTLDDWINTKKKEVNIEIYENSIRASINREIYADADSTIN